MSQPSHSPVDAKALRYAAGIGLAYAAAGVAWILASDALVSAISNDPAWLAAAQRYKGLSYVLATSVGLAWLIRVGYARLLRAIDEVHAGELLSRQALERQEAQFRQLHDSLAEVLWLASPDGKSLHYVSPAFERLYGIAAQALQREPELWFASIHPDDRAVARASHEAVLRDGQASCEYRVLRPDGTQRWLAERKRLIVDAEGRLRLIGGIGEDITALKSREAEAALAQARLEYRVAERTAELQRVNAELEAFARTAAHDLKAPLNSIAGFVNLLGIKYGPSLDADFARMTGHVEQSARRMAALVNDLLALSRVSAGELAPVEVDLALLAREVIDELRRQQPSRRVEFQAPASLCVWADPGLMRSLLDNLLGNAWKFSSQRESALIRLDALAADEGSALSISDNGAGFDASQQERLFKPFERFHSMNEFQGTGIGLATCQRIMVRHQGRIELDSEPGRGTTVRLYFPAPGDQRQRCSHSPSSVSNANPAPA